MKKSLKREHEEGPAHSTKRTRSAGATLSNKQEPSASITSPKRKVNEGSISHDPSCSDMECTVCVRAGVELDAAAVKGLSPWDMYRSAREQIRQLQGAGSKEPDGEDMDTNISLASQLLEKAIDELEQAHPNLTSTKTPTEFSTKSRTANESDAINLDSLEEESIGNSLACKILHARCLRELGTTQRVPEFLELSVKSLREVCKAAENATNSGSKTGITKRAVDSTYLELGVSVLEWARYLKGCFFNEDCCGLLSDAGDYGSTDINDIDMDDEENEDLDEADEGEMGDEEGKTAAHIAELIQEARTILLKCVASKVLNVDAEDRMRVARIVWSFALAVRSVHKKDPTPPSLFTFTLGLLSEVDENSPRSDLQTLGLGTALFYLGQLRQVGDPEGAANDIRESVTSLESIIDPDIIDQAQEIMGQGYLMLSSITEDDDEAIEAFEKGVSLLKEVSAMHPEKEALRAQVETLETVDDVAEEDGEDAEEAEWEDVEEDLY